MEILPLTEETMGLEMDLCLTFHPSGYEVPETDAWEGRRAKESFLKRVFERVRPAGFVAVEDGEPVALLELMPREYARRNGYITGNRGEDGETLTIACMEVAWGQDRRRAMDAMVAHLVESLGLFRPYRAVEVGAFPRDVDFHPAWVYEKHGFEVAEDRGAAVVLSVPVP
jgi:hypothetical protein